MSLDKRPLYERIYEDARQIEVYVLNRENGTSDALRRRYLEPIRRLFEHVSKVKELEEKFETLEREYRDAPRGSV